MIHGEKTGPKKLMIFGICKRNMQFLQFFKKFQFSGVIKNVVNFVCFTTLMTGCDFI